MRPQVHDASAPDDKLYEPLAVEQESSANNVADDDERLNRILILLKVEQIVDHSKAVRQSAKKIEGLACSLSECLSMRERLLRGVS